MKSSGISQRRRQVMIAGALTATTPLTLFASDCQYFSNGTLDALGTVTPGLTDKLVLSGRIVDRHSNAVLGASIEAPFADNAKTTSDADGRFMLVIDRRSAEAARTMPLKVTHPEHRMHVARLALSQPSHVVHDLVAPLARDEAGAWRTALSLVLA